MSSAPVRWGRPLDTLVASIRYLAVASPNLRQTADFYARAMGYCLQPCGETIIARGPDRHLIFHEGPAKSLVSAGFAVPDSDELERLKDRIRKAGAIFREVTSVLLADAIETIDPDGNRLVFGLAQDTADGPVAQGMPARLQHVVVASRDPERIVRFFIDALGFTLSDDVIDSEGGVRTSFLRCSDEHHSFAVFKAAQARLDHHCYETTNWNKIRDWGDHMASQHVPIQWGPGRHGPGNNLFLFVHDPDGNWVEISAELETVEHDRPVGRWPHEQRTLNSWGQGLLRS